MKMKTKEIWECFWCWLRSQDQTWNNKTAFLKWTENQPEVDCAANETWITKLYSEEEWGPNNCRLVNIWSKSDFNQILEGAFTEGDQHANV